LQPASALGTACEQPSRDLYGGRWCKPRVEALTKARRLSSNRTRRVAPQYVIELSKVRFVRPSAKRTLRKFPQHNLFSCSDEVIYVLSDRVRWMALDRVRLHLHGPSQRATGSRAVTTAAFPSRRARVLRRLPSTPARDQSRPPNGPRWRSVSL
jgi:hypothetical protein